jgi:hypothetical protein
MDCLRVLLILDGRFKPIARIHITMLCAAFAMFVFASLDVAFHLRHNIEVFIYHPGDPIAQFSEMANWLNVISMGCYVAQTFIGDSILVSPLTLPPVLSPVLRETQVVQVLDHLEPKMVGCVGSRIFLVGWNRYVVSIFHQMLQLRFDQPVG